MTREELQRLYGECVSRAFRAEQLAGLVRGVESFLAEPDPTVEIAELLADNVHVEADLSGGWADLYKVKGDAQAKRGKSRRVAFGSATARAIHFFRLHQALEEPVPLPTRDAASRVTLPWVMPGSRS